MTSCFFRFKLLHKNDIAITDKIWLFVQDNWMWPALLVAQWYLFYNLSPIFGNKRVVFPSTFVTMHITGGNYRNRCSCVWLPFALIISSFFDSAMWSLASYFAIFIIKYLFKVRRIDAHVLNPSHGHNDGDMRPRPWETKSNKSFYGKILRNIALYFLCDSRWNRLLLV